VHVGASLVAHQQAAEAVQPGEAALHDPALGAEAGAVSGTATGDLRADAAGAQATAVAVVVIAAVGEQLARTPQRSSGTATHRRHCVEQRQELGDVVAVAAGQDAGERDAARVDEQVVLGARPAAVDRARARRGAPFFACTWLESTTAREKSI